MVRWYKHLQQKQEPVSNCFQFKKGERKKPQDTHRAALYPPPARTAELLSLWAWHSSGDVTELTAVLQTHGVSKGLR